MFNAFAGTNGLRFATILFAVITNLCGVLSTERANAQATDEPATSPVLRIDPTQEPKAGIQDERSILGVDEHLFRSIDGSGNNPDDLGKAFTPLVRLVPAAYGDGESSLARQDSFIPGPRQISNAVNAQDEGESILNGENTSDFLWQWGQFLDHDIDLTDAIAEDASFYAPSDDPHFPDYLFPFRRSRHNGGSPRQQINEITAFIDASNVYGSDLERANALRTLDGTGSLRTHDGSVHGDLLPYNEYNLPNANGPREDYDNLVLAGDVRANEQILLTAMHTLFVREHNRLADIIAADHPTWNDEQIYQKARQLVGAEMQIITYNEFLPALLGKDAIAPYKGHDPDVNPAIANIFATAAFRLGHSMLSSTYLRFDENFEEITGQDRKFCNGHLPLRHAFFQPELIKFCGVEALLRGAANQIHQKIDVKLVTDVRNFLFGPPGAGGFDLASLNIQRGRDHGLPSYNQVRIALGLAPAVTFDDVSSDTEVVDHLAAVYLDVNHIDPWVGMIAEDHVEGAQVGELLYTILKDQFERLRDGDSFWHELTLTKKELRELRSLTLGRIIALNTGITDMPDDVFHVKAKRGRSK